MVAIAVGAVLLLGVPANARAAGGPARDDVYVLHCLSEEHRAEVVRAAVRLGEARAVKGDPGSLTVGSGGRSRRLTVGEWVAGHRGSFRRVCSAFIRAESVEARSTASRPDGGKDEGGWGDLLKSSLLLAIGAALTTLGGFGERSAARRRRRIETLEAAASAYAHQAEAFLSGWAGDPGTSHDGVGCARVEVVTALRALPGWRARRRAACTLAEALPLRDPPDATADAGMAGRRSLNRDERHQLAGDLRDALTGVMPEVDAMAVTAVRWYPRHLCRMVARRWRRHRCGGEGGAG